MERCPYCEAEVVSVALHIAICPKCAEDVSEEERSLIHRLEATVQKTLDASQEPKNPPKKRR